MSIATIAKAISAGWYGYAGAVLIGIPSLFLWRSRWDRRVRKARRRMRMDTERERDLGIGDEALVSSTYGKRINGGRGWR